MGKNQPQKSTHHVIQLYEIQDQINPNCGRSQNTGYLLRGMFQEEPHIDLGRDRKNAPWV